MSENPRQFTILDAPAAVLMRPNIDTDVIIRIDRLLGADAGKLGDYCFEALRTFEDGRPDPSFFLNDPACAGAAILVAGANFGCGSSREGAVTALKAAGIRCILAPSFGDIFFNNCFQNGVLPVVLDAAVVERLAALVETVTRSMTIDLERQEIRSPALDAPIAFEVDPLRRHALLLGLDEIDVTLGRAGEIDAYQQRIRARTPWVWPEAAG